MNPIEKIQDQVCHFRSKGFEHLALKIDDLEFLLEALQERNAALLWALYHHQGGSSPVGQPIRKLLGIGAFADLSSTQLIVAKAFAAKGDQTNG